MSVVALTLFILWVLSLWLLLTKRQQFRHALLLSHFFAFWHH